MNTQSFPDEFLDFPAETKELEAMQRRWTAEMVEAMKGQRIAEVVRYSGRLRRLAEELERRWVALAVRSARRRLMIAKESGAKGPPAKKEKAKLARRNRWLNSEFLKWKKWKKKSGHSRLSPEKFREDIIERLWALPERLRRQCTPHAKFLSKRQFRNIFPVRTRIDR